MPRPSTAFALCLVMVLCAGPAETAFARSKKIRSDQLSVPSIMKDESGTPIIMKGLQLPRTRLRENDRPKGQAERPTNVPRGSATYVPPSVPSPPQLTPPSQPRVLPYNPPPINSFSDRVTQCNQSFSFNAGVGNNPVGRDAYVRSCAN